MDTRWKYTKKITYLSMMFGACVDVFELGFLRYVCAVTIVGAIDRDSSYFLLGLQ